VEERLLAVTRDTAAKIARLSLRQVDYWAKTDLVPASIEGTISSSRRVRLYSFLDVLALTVAAELKQRGVSLQHIRQIVRHLGACGYDHPLTQLSYATIGKQVFFQREDGTWEGGLQPDQIVLHEVLNLQPIRERIAEGVHRDEAQAGRTERRRGALGNKPLLAGTRIPVDTVRRYLQAGRSTSDVLEAYPDLTEADIEAVRRDMVA
jgi:uncharacterized protein (DUF433 family)